LLRDWGLAAEYQTPKWSDRLNDQSGFENSSSESAAGQRYQQHIHESDADVELVCVNFAAQVPVICDVPDLSMRFGNGRAFGISLAIYGVLASVDDDECRTIVQGNHFWKGLADSIHRSPLEADLSLVWHPALPFHGQRTNPIPLYPLLHFGDLKHWTAARDSIITAGLHVAPTVDDLCQWCESRNRIPFTRRQSDVDPAEFSVGCLVFALYDAIHALLWNSYFPTGTERWLWRCSCLSMCSMVLVAVYALPCGNPTSEETDCRGRTVPLKLVRAIKAVWPWLKREFVHISTFFHLVRMDAAAISMFYFFTRVYIVVEAFAQLRSLQPAAFESLEWTQWPPHL
jgi:hypothetical protein